MPAWLEILLAVAGTLNLVGFIVWIIKTLFELKGRLDRMIKEFKEEFKSQVRI